MTTAGAATLRRGLLAIVVVTALLGPWPWRCGGLAAPPRADPGTQLEYVDATVTAWVGDCISLDIPDALTSCQLVTADVTSGRASGSVASFRIYETDFEKPELDVGDRVVLLRNPQIDPTVAYTFNDFQRGVPLLALAVLFVVVVIAFGRLAGLRALVGIAVSFLVIFLFLLPSLLRGNPALPVAMAATVSSRPPCSTWRTACGPPPPSPWSAPS